MLLLAGCHGKTPAVPARDWKTTSNALFYLGLRAVGRNLTEFPEPGLDVGKATLPQVTEFLQKFSPKPAETKEGDTADKGFHYLEATLDDQARFVFYFAKDGGFAGKLTYFSVLVFMAGDDDPLLPLVEGVFGKAPQYEKLVVNSDEGRSESDVDVESWQTPIGVLTERTAYSEEDETTVGVLELWAPPAYGQARPQL